MKASKIEEAADLIDLNEKIQLAMVHCKREDAKEWVVPRLTIRPVGATPVENLKLPLYLVIEMLEKYQENVKNTAEIIGLELEQ